MNSALQWKLITGFVLVFLAGLATGGFIGATHSRHWRAEFAPHHSLVERMRSRMQARLDLTPEQIAKTAPIFDKAAGALESIRTETDQRVQQVLGEADRELAPELTPAQRTRLEALEKQHRAIRGQRNSPRHREPQPPNP